MNRRLSVLAIGGLLAALSGAAAQTTKSLDIYTIDVEGGKSVLIVSPSGESMLIDAGWPKSAAREASTDVIVEAVKNAGLAQIDYLVVSHFDVDHIGDVPALAARIPIRHIVDHGEMQLPPTPVIAPEAATPVPNRGGGGGAALDRFKAYAALRQTIPHTVAKPGDRIPLKGVSIEVVTAAGAHVSKPLTGAGTPNALCATNPQSALIERDVEDNLSIGLLITFGNFRMLDLADLEAHRSHELVCPLNLIGQVDVYHVNVHGQFKGLAPEMVAAIRPTVALLGNGARKGADPQSWPILRAAAGLQDVWQTHYAEHGTAETNAPADFIANLQGPADDHKLIKLSVSADGTYTLRNARNGFNKTYRAVAATRR
jgi:competence protein ComEC